MTLFNHQRLAMLIKEEADTRGRHSRPEGQGVCNQGVEIEELNHLQRTPYFFPATRLIRRVEHVDHRPFQRGDANLAAGMPDGRHAAPLLRNAAKCQGRLNRDELQIAKRYGPRALTRHVVKAAPHRIRLAMKLQRCMVRNDRIVRKMAGDEVRIDSRIRCISAGRDDGEQTAAHADEPARREVLRQQVRAGVAAASPGRVGTDELTTAKDRLGREEV